MEECELKFKEVKGFTMIMDLIKERKIPVIVHNSYTDILFIFNNF